VAKNNILLVEGKDDKNVLEKLIAYYHVTDTTFEVKDTEGIANLLQALPTYFKGSDRTALGIMVDADNDLKVRWQSLSNILQKKGYTNLPTGPDSNGTIIEQLDLPRVGIWLMPDNKMSGMLEDFISFLVPNSATNQLWQLSEKCLGEARSFSASIPEAKGRIHTWLAWQENPGTPLGLAITKRYLDPNVAQAQMLIDWVNRLFNPAL
jgi:hypothetical protein